MLAALWGLGVTHYQALARARPFPDSDRTRTDAFERYPQLTSDPRPLPRRRLDREPPPHELQPLPHARDPVVDPGALCRAAVRHLPGQVPAGVVGIGREYPGRLGPV